MQKSLSWVDGGLMNKYTLEIHGNTKAEIASFESNEPFMAISKGDIIDPSWFDSPVAKYCLRVANVHHLIKQEKNSEIHHSITVYADEIPKNYDLHMFSQ